MPKLKVGDTFVYTKEMAEAKEKTRYSKSNWEIGDVLTITDCDDDSYNVGGEVFMFPVVDNNLNQILKTPKRTWKTELKSSDGIEIKDGEVSLKVEYKYNTCKFEFTPNQLTTLANQIRAAKLQLKKLK